MAELSAAERPLPLKRRRDLVVEPVVLRGRRNWHLKDPLAMSYWQFGDEEFFLWQQLDGCIGLAEWQARFQERFSPRRIELRQLQAFLGMLHREGLAVSQVPGQAEMLLARREQNEQMRRWRELSNVLAIRFRGIDPDRFLTRISPMLAWCFHPLTLLVAVLFVISGGALLLLNWSEFTGRLPEFRTFLTPASMIYLACALALAKVLHELGHAVTSKHFGGECHELGVMLLVFTPCLYCNVSDMWLVPNRWRRIAVSAAGICVELGLAALATWLWWLTEPGVFNSLCLSIMLVCSISTVAFNGNPLLRYDGYFVLSDLVGVANLRSVAEDQLRKWLKKHLAGIQSDSAADEKFHPGLLAYAAASFAYRVMAIGLVTWFVYQWLAENRLEMVGRIAVVLLAMSVSWPAVWRARQFMKAPQRTAFSTGRVIFSMTIAFLLVGAFLWIPVPMHVVAPVAIRPAKASVVYVTAPGTLVDCVDAGKEVKQGDELARLQSPQLEFEILKLTAQRDSLRKQLEQVRRQQVQDSRTGIASASAQRPSLEQALKDAEEQLKQRSKEREQLVLRAPCDGIVVRPRPRMAEHDEDELSGWSGTPLDPENRGCFLEAGVQFCLVSEPEHIEATMLIEQGQIGRIEVGQSVQVQLDHLPGRSLNGRIVAISEMKTRDPLPEFAQSGELPVLTGSDRPELAGTYYEARVELEPATVPFGSVGRGRIRTPSETLATRLYESLSRTIRHF